MNKAEKREKLTSLENQIKDLQAEYNKIKLAPVETVAIVINQWTETGENEYIYLSPEGWVSSLELGERVGKQVWIIRWDKVDYGISDSLVSPSHYDFAPAYLSVQAAQESALIIAEKLAKGEE